MSFVVAAIALPTLLLLVAWFVAPPPELLRPPDADHKDAPDQAWLIAPWWIL